MENSKCLGERKLAVIGLVAVFVFSGIALTIPSSVVVASALPASSNSVLASTDFELLNLTMDEESDVTDHFWPAHYLLGGLEANQSIEWDEATEVANYTSTRNATGVMAIGGFYPAVECEISMSVLMGSYGFNGVQWSFTWYGVYLGMISYGSYVRCYEFYYDESDVLKTSYTNSPIWGVGLLHWIDITIDWVGNRTYHYEYSYNGTTIRSGWSMARQSYDYTNPDTPFSSMAIMTFTIGSSGTYETNYSCYLDNMTQTMNIDADSIYANPSHSKYTGMGYDGPYSDSITNASSVLISLNQSATWYFIESLEDDADGWTEADMEYLLENGQEFGIHSGSPNPLTYNATNIALIDARFDYLYSMANTYGWDNSSISWTSLGNGYDWEFNDYVYDTYQSIGRKMWLHWFTNLGGWYDEYNFTAGAAERGIPFVGYNHKIGPVTDVLFSDWYSQVNTSMANGLNIVGIGEYWFRYSAPFYVDVTQSGALFTVEYDDYNVWNDFELTIDQNALALENHYLGIFDLTDEVGVTEIDYGTDYAIINATDSHQYAMPVSAISSTTVVMNMTRCSPELTVFNWESTLGDDSTSVTYYVRGLDSDSGYKVYQNGVVIITATGSSFSFTAIGGGEFEVVLWNTKTVTTLMVLTINMVGLGIMASVVVGWVLPFSRDIKNGRFRSTDAMIKELIHGVIFIVVGCFMYVMLYNVAIG